LVVEDELIGFTINGVKLNALLSVTVRCIRAERKEKKKFF